MNARQERYDKVLAGLNSRDPEADGEGSEEAPRRVYGGLNPMGAGIETYDVADLVRQYRSGAGSPFRGEMVKPGDR